eukprot:1874020-Pyramimonas_sp.AAC.1
MKSARSAKRLCLRGFFSSEERGKREGTKTTPAIGTRAKPCGPPRAAARRPSAPARPGRPPVPPGPPADGARTGGPSECCWAWPWRSVTLRQVRAASVREKVFDAASTLQP